MFFRHYSSYLFHHSYHFKYQFMTLFINVPTEMIHAALGSLQYVLGKRIGYDKKPQHFFNTFFPLSSRSVLFHKKSIHLPPSFIALFQLKKKKVSILNSPSFKNKKHGISLSKCHVDLAMTFMN